MERAILLLALFAMGCAHNLTETLAPPAPIVKEGSASDLSGGTDTVGKKWSAKTLSDAFLGVTADKLFVEGQTQVALDAADTTPDVTYGGSTVAHSLVTGGVVTIIDFDDGDDHSEFADGDWFLLTCDHAITLDLSSNTEMLGHNGEDWTATVGDTVLFVYDLTNTRWLAHVSAVKVLPGVALRDNTTPATDGMIQVYDNTTDDRYESKAISGHASLSASGVLTVTRARRSELAVADLNDTSSPHVLTQDEVSGTIISNYASSGADRVFTLPAAFDGGDVDFVVGDEYQVEVEPPSGDAVALNGTAGLADQHLVNVDDTLYEKLHCEVANINGTLEWVCDSDDANWTSATTTTYRPDDDRQTDWNDGTGITYAEVDEATSDGDTTTHVEDTAWEQQHHYFEDTAKTLISNVTVYAVCKTNVGSDAVRFIFREADGDGGERAYSDQATLTTDYSTISWSMDQDPVDTIDWTASKINNGSFGYQVRATGNTVTCTQLYLTVTGHD